jgi:hypothetical protein
LQVPCAFEIADKLMRRIHTSSAATDLREVKRFDS